MPDKMEKIGLPIIKNKKKGKIRKSRAGRKRREETLTNKITSLSMTPDELIEMGNKAELILGKKNISEFVRFLYGDWKKRMAAEFDDEKNEKKNEKNEKNEKDEAS